MNLTNILEDALQNRPLNREALARLVSPQNEQEEAAIFAAAQKQRAQHTGEAIFAYGFVYLSTYCRNDCRFCAYRLGNPEAIRYRKKADEVLEASRALAQDGVHLIDLTLGEDPLVDDPQWQDETADLIAEVKKQTSRPVMISPGVASPLALGKFKKAGADWFACYQETHNRELFTRLRSGQDYDLRYNSKKEAQNVGLLIEEGALCGVGETAYDLADSILAMKELGPDQVRAMGFVPPAEAEKYPEKNWAPAPPPGLAQTRELHMIAALRLALPHTLIPASLDVEGLSGLKTRLLAGANLVTSLVPAGRGFAGVAQASLDIDNCSRSVSGILPILAEMGLRLARQEEYNDFLAERQAGHN